MQGIFVAPEVIDPDFEGQIEVMTHPPNPISVVKTGHRLAQQILLPQVQTKNPVKRSKRGESGFDSSDAYWFQITGSQRPELTLFIM